jgi:hypothetical protein
MSIKVPQGGRSPFTLSIALTPADPSLDLTTVTAVAFRVLRQDGARVTWPAHIADGATPTSLVATYMFAPDGSDLAVAGHYALVPLLSVLGGTVDGTTVDLSVESAFAFRR